MKLTFSIFCSLVAFGLVNLLAAPGCKHCFREQRNLMDLPGACRLVPDPGPCEAAMPRFYFDVDRGDCHQFLWGGCDGVVPFETLEQCEQACY